MAIAMLSTQPPGSLLTCNGYKDAEYMELVCGGRCCLCMRRLHSCRLSIPLVPCVLCAAWLHFRGQHKLGTSLFTAWTRACWLGLTVEWTKRTAVRLVTRTMRSSQTQVLHGRQLGIDCVVILEQYAELAMLLEAAARLGVQPAIGVRARLSTHHGG